MKKNNIIALIGATVAITVGFDSCSDVLDEHPRATLTADFKGTDAGMEGSLANLYTSLRNIYGQGYYFNACETGTDEFTYGASADANFKDADHSEGANTLNSENCRCDVIWNPMINSINSASQMIEEGERVSVDNCRSILFPSLQLLRFGTDIWWCAFGLGKWRIKT